MGIDGAPVSIPETIRHETYGMLSRLFDAVSVYVPDRYSYHGEKRNEGFRRETLSDGTILDMLHYNEYRDGGSITPERITAKVTRVLPTGRREVSFTLARVGLLELHIPRAPRTLTIGEAVVPLPSTDFDYRRDMAGYSPETKKAMEHGAQPLVEWVEQIHSEQQYVATPAILQYDNTDIL